MTLGDTGDELGYLRQLIDVARQKADGVGYAERRAQEMASGDMEDYSLEGKYTSVILIMIAFLNRGSNTCHGGNHGEREGPEAVSVDDTVLIRAQLGSYLQD